jgi:hypothetical protein
MPFKFLFPALLALTSLLQSCSSTNAASGELFQKRKYNKGIHFDGFRKHAHHRGRVAEISGDTSGKELVTNESAAVQKNLFRPLKSDNAHSLIAERKSRRSEIIDVSEKRIKQAIGFADSPLDSSIEDPDLVYHKSSPPVVAIIGFITSIVGFLVAGIILGVLSIVLGVIGMNLIQKSEKKRKGKFFAIFAIILGFVDVIDAVILLGTLI